MTVIIKELEELPVSTASQPATRGGSGNDAATPDGSPGTQPGQLLSLIRREASRQSRLWAD
jgi:hypothetical protein